MDIENKGELEESQVSDRNKRKCQSVVEYQAVSPLTLLPRRSNF